MQIYWFGQACFRISLMKNRSEPINIVIDPFSDDIGLKMPSLEADILLVSHSHYDHNNISKIKAEPFLIREPGEYEIKGVFFQAIPSFHDQFQGRERGENLIFTLEAEDIKLCHLGDFGQRELSEEQLEKIGEVDILMIPVGGIYTIDAHQARDIISQIEPKIVIPMHYFLPGLKIKLDGLDKFLQAIGQKKIEPQPKLKIQKKDLPSEETKIIFLEPYR